ncbi:MAG: CDP-alcohol phosphatidyltransferase family protein [Sulfurimonadaceae bacterium]
MITIYDLKPRFQNLLRPLVQAMAKAGVSANAVTLFAVFVSIAAGAALFLSKGAVWALFCIPVVLFVRMALNAIDGMLAKEHAMKSDLGALLNEMGDVVSDAALYLPFALIGGIDPLWVVLFVVVAIFTEMIGVLAVTLQRERAYDGPMGKSDRAFVMGALSLAMACGFDHFIAINLIIIAATSLGMWTVVRRGKKALAC